MLLQLLMSALQWGQAGCFVAMTLSAHQLHRTQCPQGWKATDRVNCLHCTHMVERRCRRACIAVGRGGGGMGLHCFPFIFDYLTLIGML